MSTKPTKGVSLNETKKRLVDLYIGDRVQITHDNLTGTVTAVNELTADITCDDGTRLVRWRGADHLRKLSND
jgi:preprotein translocase subunit YajC